MNRLSNLRLYFEGFFHGAAFLAILLTVFVWSNWPMFRAACKFTI